MSKGKAQTSDDNPTPDPEETVWSIIGRKLASGERSTYSNYQHDAYHSERDCRYIKDEDESDLIISTRRHAEEELGRDECSFCARDENPQKTYEGTDCPLCGTAIEMTLPRHIREECDAT